MTCDCCYACYGEIADIVAGTDGLYRHQSKGGDASLLHRIWNSVGAILQEQLIEKKSCIITDFLHASVKVQKIQFYDGIRTFYKPQLVLLPDFQSKFHLTNVLTMHDAHYHATVPSILPASTVAALAGTDRFTVGAALSDSIREIGKYLMRNQRTVLRIDVGVAVLEFQGRECRIKWSDAFLESFRKVVGPSALVSPYDPPCISKNATGCRNQTGCISKEGFQDSLINTIEREKRLTVVDMNDGKGGSGFRQSHW